MSRDATLRPAAACRGLLRALDAAEGRRRSRKRDTTPDAIGLGIKRAILEGVVAADPDPAELEAWLLARCLREGGNEGAWRAMAREVLLECEMAAESDDFAAWVAAGAPSDDASRQARP